MKTLFIWIFIFLTFFFAYRFFSDVKKTAEYKYISFTEFSNSITAVKSIKIKGEEIEGITKNGEKFRTFGPYGWEIVEFATKNGVQVDIIPAERASLIKDILISWGPIIVIVFLWLAFLRSMDRTNTRALSFTRSKAKLYSPKNEEESITLQDVAGIDEIKNEIIEIIDYLKNPEKYKNIGARVPKGVLFVGPPGTGKTLLAKAIANEADVPFFAAVGSEFVELFVGVGSARVRDLFERARKSAPCIIFIDEIDAIGRVRGAGIGGGHDEREQTLNQILVELDGIEEERGIVIIAATNRPDILDPALLRPGRFDRKIFFPIPDIKGRMEILKVHLRKVKIEGEIDVEKIARSIPGFVGADIENMINEAAILALREGRDAIIENDIIKARDKIIMGIERKSTYINEEQKRRIAYHESGHTLTAKIENAEKVEKVSIIPRGRALGITVQTPEDDLYILDENYINKKLAVLLGGRAAEEIVFGNFSTGAADDLEKATEIARKMVCEWGMSSLGPVSFKTREEHIFLGKEIARYQEFSEDTARKIDEEVIKIIHKTYEKTKKIILENIEKLHKLARALIEKETLTEKEITEIIG